MTEHTHASRAAAPVAGDAVGGDADWTGASTALWREREALEKVLFKLVQQQLLLSAGNVRFLHLIDDELHEAAEGLRAAEVIRSAEFEVLARQAGLPASATLSDFIAAAPEPWPLVLDGHRTALYQLALDTKGTARGNLRMLQAGASAIRETLANLSGHSEGYNGSGGRTGESSRALILDQQA